MKKKKNKKKNKHIEVFLYKRSPQKGILFLLMKRIPQRGDFWQPLTGTVEKEETLKETIKREIGEETGITDELKIIDSGYSFEFSENGEDFIEYVYGVKVANNTKIVLSREHDEYKWVDKDEAIKLLKWPGNKAGLKSLCRILKA